MTKIRIEWKHFEVNGETCERCFTTGNSLKKVIEESRRNGIEIELIETVLLESEMRESNSLTFNGVPIETLLNITSSTNCCTSCSDLTGKPTQCRTIQVGTANYEAIPKEIIEKALHKLIPNLKE